MPGAFARVLDQAPLTDDDPVKADLHRHLQAAREALLWELERTARAAGERRG